MIKTGWMNPFGMDEWIKYWDGWTNGWMEKIMGWNN